MNDIQAIELALAKRQEGYKAIFANHANYVFTHAFRLIKHKESAEDLTQETFKDAFRFLQSFKGKSSLRTWIYKILFNKALRQLKKNQSAPLLSEPGEEDNAYAKVEAKIVVNEVIDSLGEKERSLLILAYWDNLKIDEIADLLGMTPTNAKVSLFRARKKFAQKWSKINGKGELSNEM
jgi:RNA polymerase sigma-70 factor (ECF subfamily)